MDDRDDLVQRPTELGGEPDEPILLLLGDRHSRRQLAPQDFVLNLEVTDLPSEFLLCRAGNDQQQRPVDVPHGVNLRKLKHHKKMASFSHTGSRFGRPIPAATFSVTASLRRGHVIAAAAWAFENALFLFSRSLLFRARC
jgi:hypothetical protein